MGALIEIREVALMEPTPEGVWQAYVDLPKAGTTIDARAVDLVGWVVGEGTRLRGVELVASGRVLARAPLAVDRPDLVAAFPGVPGVERAGFKVTLGLLDREPELELSVRAITGSGRKITFATVRGDRRWRRSRGPERDLVSVVIPCYNQAHYLGAAIESVLAQTYPHVEIVVVDDGSSDNTAAVAARYECVALVRQENEGLAAARNTGIRHSNGDYLVFLDADDCLLPHALEIGVERLDASPEAAFVAGLYSYIDHDGNPLPTPEQPAVTGDPYAAFLRVNVAGMHTAMIRRGVFELVRGFDSSVDACADYDLYLRITSQFPAVFHREIVGLYRQHPATMTRDTKAMRAQVEAVHRAQKRRVSGDPELEAAYAEGRRFWADHYPVSPPTRGRRAARLVRNSIRIPSTLLTRLAKRGGRRGN
jgi:glycosyltransferase involved in cell wall biosynthesis